MADRNSEYLYCADGVFEFRNMSPSMQLAFAVMGNFATRSLTIERIDYVLSTLLQTLTSREQRMLIEDFGLTLPISDCGSSAEYEYEQLSSERRMQIRNKAIRKLRHPSRSKKLKGEWYFPNYIGAYADCGYLNGLEEIIKKELQGLIEENGKENVYLTPILKHHNIILTVSSNKMASAKDSIREMEIEELGFSVRSYNCLKRANINTVGELLERINANDGDVSLTLVLVRGMGKKSFDEIIAKLNDLGISVDENGLRDKFTTIQVQRGQERTVYKYANSEIEQIVESFYLGEIMQNNRHNSLLKSTYSPGLINLLLMMGFLFQEDVLRNAGTLIANLQQAGFQNYADEITMVITSKNEAEAYKLSDPVCVFSGEIVEQAQDANCTDLESFMEMLENAELSEDAAVIKNTLLL